MQQFLYHLYMHVLPWWVWQILPAGLAIYPFGYIIVKTFQAKPDQWVDAALIHVERMLIYWLCIIPVLVAYVIFLLWIWCGSPNPVRFVDYLYAFYIVYWLAVFVALLMSIGVAPTFFWICQTIRGRNKRLS